jgi:hypothetical protein
MIRFYVSFPPHPSVLIHFFCTLFFYLFLCVLLSIAVIFLYCINIFCLLSTMAPPPSFAPTSHVPQTTLLLTVNNYRMFVCLNSQRYWRSVLSVLSFIVDTPPPLWYVLFCTNTVLSHFKLGIFQNTSHTSSQVLKQNMGLAEVLEKGGGVSSHYIKLRAWSKISVIFFLCRTVSNSHRMRPH